MEEVDRWTKKTKEHERRGNKNMEWPGLEQERSHCKGRALMLLSMTWRERDHPPDAPCLNDPIFTNRRRNEVDGRTKLEQPASRYETNTQNLSSKELVTSFYTHRICPQRSWSPLWKHCLITWERGEGFHVRKKRCERERTMEPLSRE